MNEIVYTLTVMDKEGVHIWTIEDLLNKAESLEESMVSLVGRTGYNMIKSSMSNICRSARSLESTVLASLQTVKFA
jgi:hypothetical protein